MIKGIGPNEPSETNEQGGKQSALAYRFDLLPTRALFAVAKVLHEGAENYGADNWRRIAIADHLNHAMMHIVAYLDGDAQDEHLSHAACRALFATDLAAGNGSAAAAQCAALKRAMWEYMTGERPYMGSSVAITPLCYTCRHHNPRRPLAVDEACRDCIDGAAWAFDVERFSKGT